MKTPVIIINFKTYTEATGENAVKLAKICEKVAKETSSEIAVAVQAADIYRVSNAVSIPVLAQHIDNVSQGKNTGYVTPESAKEAGAKGTLVNHAEHQLEPEVMMETIEMAKKLGLSTVCCAEDALAAESIASYNPDMIAVEIPELIGTGVSVSTANPEVVENAVKRVHHIKKNLTVLCGAGVSTAEDVKKSLELGTKGVLLATGVVKAKDPEKALRDLASGLK